MTDEKEVKKPKAKKKAPVKKQTETKKTETTATTKTDDKFVDAFKDITRNVHAIAALIPNIGRNGVRYQMALRVMSLFDAILVHHRSLPTSELITHLNKELKAAAITTVELGYVLASKRIEAGQHSYISTMLTLLNNASTAKGREQTAKQLSPQRVLAAVGDARFAVIQRWIDFK